MTRGTFILIRPGHDFYFLKLTLLTLEKARCCINGETPSGSGASGFFLRGEGGNFVLRPVEGLSRCPSFTKVPPVLLQYWKVSGHADGKGVGLCEVGFETE